MAYYDPLITIWPTLTGTKQEKIAQLAVLKIDGDVQKALLSASDILNACVPADLAALTSTQVSFLTLFLAGQQVDVSQGTTLRTAIRTIFTGKTTTLNNLAALVAPFDSPVKILWYQANGYPRPLTVDDATNAGLS